MYVVYIKDHIHHLLNESKKLIIAYNSDQKMYILCLNDKISLMKQLDFSYYFVIF